MEPIRIKELLFEALQQPAAERGAFVERACADDRDLARRVHELLEGHAGAGPVLASAEESSARLKFRAPAAGIVEDLVPGSRIDTYLLEAPLGEGGFGRVYRALQERPVRRPVALKVLKLGMDTRAVIERFEAERQVLAIMDHPNIARVLDAGATEGGRPYFVMELVEGEPITQFCERRGLSLDERLALFATVCRAIHHAHQKGVLHRDIKPNNVLVGLVDGTPTPKVIDFGIAKALEPEAAERSWRTREGQFLGTPAYMSPEQAAGDLDVDTRSDVYALGVLLYELLTGDPPFQGESPSPLAWAELLRRVREEDPPRPGRRVRERSRDAASSSSSLTAGLPRDLDWIVMRAMDKQRERRYPSAFSMAQDVERFLKHLPVEAGPKALGYRVRKLVRRHRVASLALLSLVAAFLIGIGGLGAGIVAARRSEAEAVEQARVAQAINAFMIGDLLSAAVPSNDPGKGRQVTVREVLDLASQEIESASAPGGRFHEVPRVQAAIRAALGGSYRSLGLPRQAEPHWVRAVELLTLEFGADHAETLHAREALAGLRETLGDYEESEAAFRSTLDAQEARAAGAGGDDPAIESLRGLALSLQSQSRHEEARDALNEALRRARATRGEDDPITCELLVDLAVVTGYAGDAIRAMELMREGHREMTRILGAEHVKTLAATATMAVFLQERGELQEARALLEETLPICERILGPQHEQSAHSRRALADILRRLGEFEQAQALLEASHAATVDTLGSDHPDELRARDGRATLLKDQGRYEEARIEFEKLCEDTARVLGEDHYDTLSRKKDLANVLFMLGRQDEALQLTLEVYEREQSVLGPDHPNTLRSVSSLSLLALSAGQAEQAEQHAREFLAAGGRRLAEEDSFGLLVALSVIAQVCLQGGRFTEAEEAAQEAVDVARDAPPDPLRRGLGYYLGFLGHALAGQGRLEEAEQAFGEALFAIEGRNGADSPLIQKACADIAAIYSELGQHEHAARWQDLAEP